MYAGNAHKLHVATPLQLVAKPTGAYYMLICDNEKPGKGGKCLQNLPNIN